MLVRDKKTGQFLSKKESEKIIKQKKQAYDDAIKDLHKQEIKTTKKNIIVKASIISASILVLILILLFILWK